MVTHIVLFRFSNGAVAREARDRLLAMAGRIPGMISIDAGVDFTRSERSYHLGLVTRHDSREALSHYQSHPVHVEVAAFIKENATGAAAVDFDAES